MAAAWSWSDYGEFGIVANVVEPDRVFRMGAKAWLSGGLSGDGLQRMRWIALSRAPHRAEKYSPLWRFGNFRAAWVPPPLQDAVTERGTREKMEAFARDLTERAARMRQEHPNRAYGRPNPSGIKEVSNG